MAAPVPMTTNAPLSAPPTTPYGTRQAGANLDRVQQYLQCEYIVIENDTPTPCTAIAVLMPGYKRSCSAHVLHVLADTLLSYLNRPLPQPETLSEAALLQTHADLARVLTTYNQLYTLLNPQPPTKAPRATRKKEAK